MWPNLGWARHWKTGRWGRLTEVSQDGTYYKLYFPDLLHHEWRRASAFILVTGKRPRNNDDGESEERSRGSEERRSEERPSASTTTSTETTEPTNNTEHDNVHASRSRLQTFTAPTIFDL